MKRLFVIIMAAAVPAGWQGLDAQGISAAGEKQLARAHHKATVDRDLNGAIEEYTRIVTGARGEPALAAQALVRMAECYEKLGDAEAQKIYERVLREYAQQADAAAVASARIAKRTVAAASMAMTTRQVWTGADVDGNGTISPEGRYVSFSGAGGNLGVRDLVTGSVRQLTKSLPDSTEWTEMSAISRDGRSVAYAWGHGSGRYELRVVPLHGTSPRPRHLYSSDDVIWLAPFDWSPDGQWIAVAISRPDRTSQLGLVSTRNGTLKVLKSVGWEATDKMVFSPDGRFLAYHLQPDDTSRPNDIYVMALDRYSESTIVEHPADDRLVGWSPDGGRLLFISDRAGSLDLWSVRMEAGRAPLAPDLVKQGVGRSWSLGITTSGAIYFGSQVGAVDVQIAEVDFGSGHLKSPPVNPITSLVGSNSWPNWSPDGTSLAYLSNRGLGTRPVAGILSLASGAVREVRPALAYFGRLEWTPDGRSWIVAGRDFKGRHGLYAVDTLTGETTGVVYGETDEYLAQGAWSPDGTKVYYRKQRRDDDPAFVERVAASGVERDVIRAPGLRNLNLSPDGRWIATRAADPQSKTDSIIVVPVAGGEPRVLMTATPSEVPAFGGWTADSGAVLVRKGKVAGGQVRESELWQAPLSGAQPMRLSLDLGRVDGPLHVHPNGSRIAYTTGRRAVEVWVLENALAPATRGTR